MTEQTVKGTSLQLTVDLVRDRHGESGIARLVEHLREDVRAALPGDLRVLPSQSIPFEVWAEVLLTAEQLFGAPRSIARDSSRFGYRRLLQTTYANWVKHGQPIESVKRMPLLWEQVTKGLGEYEVFERGDDLVVRVKLNVPPRYRALTEERVLGTIEAMLEATGATFQTRLVPFAEYSECIVAFGPAARASRQFAAVIPPKKA